MCIRDSRKTAEICEIHRNTAFNWRHKILDALQDIEDNVVLDGIVEADETFFAISYKGNHSNGGSFTMPRKPHKRGKEIHTRGLSKEQVCVACAVNRNGKSIGKVSNLGRISTKNVEDVLGDRIDENSTLVTDEMNAYVKFAKNRGINLVQIKGGKSKKGIYNVQRVNSYHSSLSRFMRGFNGVATKSVSYTHLHVRHHHGAARGIGAAVPHVAHRFAGGRPRRRAVRVA